MLLHQVRGLTRHRFYPKNGKDLYWYQNQQILDKVRATVDIPEMRIDISVQVGAKGGSLLTQDEPFFVLI